MGRLVWELRTLRTLRLTDYNEKEKKKKKWTKRILATGNWQHVNYNDFGFSFPSLSSFRFIFFFASSVFTFCSQSQSCIILIEHFPPFIAADTSEIVSETSMYISSPFFFIYFCVFCAFASRYWLGFFIHFWSGHQQTEFIVLISFSQWILGIIIIFLSLLLRSIVFRSYWSILWQACSAIKPKLAYDFNRWKLSGHAERNRALETTNTHTCITW